MCAGISRSPIVRKIRSAKGSKPRNPEARFFTILSRRLMPSPTALVSGRSMKERILSKWFRTVVTKVLSEGSRLLKAAVIQRFKNCLAAPGYVKCQMRPNSSFKTQARWMRRLEVRSAFKKRDCFLERLRACIPSIHRSPLMA